MSRILCKETIIFVENNKLTCKDGRGGLEKARLSLVASCDTAFTAWSEEKGRKVWEHFQNIQQIRNNIFM